MVTFHEDKAATKIATYKKSDAQQQKSGLLFPLLPNFNLEIVLEATDVHSEETDMR